MINCTTYGLWGGIGGLLRATIGVLKAIKRGEKFIPSYYITTTLIAWLLGIIAGFSFTNDSKIAILIGYAGTDIIEGIIKTIKRK